MKKNKYITIGFIVIVGIALLLWATNQELSVVQKAELSNLLEQGEKKIDLAQLIDSSWTKADVFGPYTQPNWIEESMDVKFGLFSDPGEVLESEFLLVITNERKVVTTISLSREYGDYEIEDNRYLSVQ